MRIDFVFIADHSSGSQTDDFSGDQRLRSDRFDGEEIRVLHIIVFSSERSNRLGDRFLVDQCLEKVQKEKTLAAHDVDLRHGFTAIIFQRFPIPIQQITILKIFRMIGIAAGS